jgi:hypothetical protein
MRDNRSAWLRACRAASATVNMEEEVHFKSWRQALAAGRLSPDQLAVLERMVKDGEADTIEAAAARLDWQDTVINPDEHMYGF